MGDIFIPFHSTKIETYCQSLKRKSIRLSINSVEAGFISNSQIVRMGGKFKLQHVQRFASDF